MIKIQVLKEKYHDLLRNYSSRLIQNEVLTITSEHPSSAGQFETKLKPNIPLSNNFLKKTRRIDRIQGRASL